MESGGELVEWSEVLSNLEMNLYICSHNIYALLFLSISTTENSSSFFNKIITSHHFEQQQQQQTIDNDVYPIKQTFGAQTAAEQGAKFFENVVNECSANPRMLILHEVMGRDSGYLTSATALEYRKILAQQEFFSASAFPYNGTAARDVHAIWIPEVKLDLVAEGARLKAIMDKVGCVNVFFGEGTGVQEIVADMESRGEEVPRDAFGHVALAKINPGAYFSKHLAKAVDAEKTLVQKSGYFSRASAANDFDIELIGNCAKEGVASAISGVSGCMGEDEDKEGAPIRAIEFNRIKGGKPFDISNEWFQQMLKEIGQMWIIIDNDDDQSKDDDDNNEQSKGMDKKDENDGDASRRMKRSRL